MPKRPRPTNAPRPARKRKTRRSPLFTAEDVYLSPTSAVALEEPPEAEAPASRRAEARQRRGEQSYVIRVPGQLPTFERGYLVDELRRITITAGSLLLLIIVLTLLLR